MNITPMVPGLGKIDSEFEILHHDYKILKIKRSDGLIIFLDLFDNEINRTLNKIRVNCSPEIVFQAVGLIRGFQISKNYERTYGFGNTEKLSMDYLQSIFNQLLEYNHKKKIISKNTKEN